MTRSLPTARLGAPLLALLLAGCHTAKIGERAAGQDLALTVDGIRYLDLLTDDLGRTVQPLPAGRRFALVDVRLENLRGRCGTVAEEDFKLAAGSEAAAQPPVRLESWPSALNRFLGRTLAQGQAERGTLVYVVTPGQPMHRLRWRGASATTVDLGDQLVPPVPGVMDPLPGVGATATAGRVAFRVNAASFPDKLKTNLFTTTPVAGQKLCYLDVTVKNVDPTRSLVVNPLNVKAYDAKGGAHVSALDAYALEHPLNLTTLAPGGEVRGEVVISVPAEASIPKVRYATGVVGAPLEIGLIR